ncbi:STAS domain-containing protein [Psychrobacillus sp. PGGUH221]|uniref:STAS domain-containing protein n=1 Tax=Psychrobacillus sp. PGGUH221 TaxID=3020058 RepID=UPI0035C6FED7
MDINVLKEEQDNVCTLHVSGLLDYSTMDSFIEKVHSIKDGTNRVIINFESLEFIDSTGIGAIINLAHKASEMQFKVELVGISEENEDLFNMIGVFEIIEALQMEG